ncbi:MAG: hypothetical protein RMH84_05965 [Sulfolobales archaeon]|nr:hypothetical protein [Sulfolobales archaeon]MDW8011118.1 hypothetical protein [Sulfolobales archaeon]
MDESPSVVYEDNDVIVVRAPSDEELERIVVDILARRGKPVSWKELRRELSGVVGEDRLRKVLIRLVERDEVVEMIDGTFGLKGMEETYTPARTKKRVRPLVPSRFRKRWGHLIEATGSISAAIQYLIDMKLKERKAKPR